MANRVAALLSKMFNFALDRDLVEASPAVRIPRPAVERARDRVLTEDELRLLWKEFETLEANMAAFYKLRLVTAQRGGEVATCAGSMSISDAAGGRSPPRAARTSWAHRVPLTPSALDILETLRAEADRRLEAREEAGKRIEEPVFVLEGARGKRQQAIAASKFSVTNFKGHDLRRTAASYMASGGISRLTIGKILNHVERGVTAVYDRHSYDPEKRRTRLVGRATSTDRAGQTARRRDAV